MTASLWYSKPGGIDLNYRFDAPRLLTCGTYRRPQVPHRRCLPPVLIFFGSSPKYPSSFKQCRTNATYE